MVELSGFPVHKFNLFFRVSTSKYQFYISIGAVLNAPITCDEPLKQFVICLTVEQVSQCNCSWHKQDVKSIETIQKIENLQLFNGRANKTKFNQSEIKLEAKRKKLNNMLIHYRGPSCRQ